MFATDDRSPSSQNAADDPVADEASRDPAPGERFVSTLIEAPADRRRSIERFVAQRFAEVYGAQVTSFLPRLFAAVDDRGLLSAVFGLRGADSGALFLEQYLDEPVEAAVERRFGVRVERRRIAEVGNLAGASPGALRALIPALTQRLHAEGYRYVAFTGSARLCNGFSRLGLPLHVVAPAPPERLPSAERARWGSYYQHAPAVMLGDIAVGVDLLRAMSARPAQLHAQLAPLARVGAP